MMDLISRWIDICFTFGKIGLLSLGGGNAMLKMIEFEVANNHAWISSEEFSQLTGASFLFPGLTAVKLSAIVGFKAGGIIGAFFAFLSLNLPGIILTLLGIYILQENQDSKAVQKLIILVQYSALAVLAAAVYAIATPVLKNSFSWIYLLGAIGLLLLMIIFDISPFIGLLFYIGLFFFF